jgi:uncharacterized protein YacL
MTSELALRLVGMVVFTLAGARLGVELAVPPLSIETFSLSFGLMGALVGLILTPYFTTRPARAARRIIQEMPAEMLVTSIIGLIFGLVVAALFSVPLGMLPQPWSQWMPSILAVVAAYVGITIFGFRAQDVFQLGNRMLRGGEEKRELPAPDQPLFNDIQILMDSSVIIDGRILDISKTGFLTGQIIVPQFVLHELQHIADESNPQRRARGRRGLEILEEMQRDSKIPIFIMDIDAKDVREVDHKLIALAREMNALLLTTDHNLNRTAHLQGVQVLNVNDLANAVKAVLLPGDVLTLQIIAEGREPGQGVGYLEDGTMVVVEEGRRLIDRTVEVVVTRMIQTAAGKMYFARPEDNPRK